MTGQDRHKLQVDALIDALQGDALANIYAHATFFNSFEVFLETSQCVLCGVPSDPQAQDLRHAVLRRSIANRCLVHVKDASALPEEHPAHGKSLLDGKPTLYVCKGTRCSLPVTTPEQLSDLTDFL